MKKNALMGLIVFGVLGALAGFIWTVFEFPFALLIPAAVGWYLVVRTDYGSKTALWAGIVGGVTFTTAFVVALFFALTDGSPFALTAWMSATLAAAVAGLLTGWLLDGLRGSLAMAGFSAVGMLAATVVAGVLRAVAPDAIDQAGPAQAAYFSAVMGVVGAFVGAAIGAGASWVAMRRGSHSDTLPGASAGTPHPG